MHVEAQKGWMIYSILFLQFRQVAVIQRLYLASITLPEEEKEKEGEAEAEADEEELKKQQKKIG